MMIDYKCKYSNETWEASIVPIEKAKDYSRLRITSDLFNDVNIFLWHKDHEYWLTIPKNNIACMLAYPTDTFWNFEAIARCTDDKYFSKTISIGISEYYKFKENTIDIEEYIKKLRGRLNAYKSSLVLYDQQAKIYYVLSNIDRKTDSCTMLAIPINKDYGYCEISTPFISQLNAYYGHCKILRENKFLQKNIRDLMKQYQ